LAAKSVADSVGAVVLISDCLLFPRLRDAGEIEAGSVLFSGKPIAVEGEGGFELLFGDAFHDLGAGLAD